MTDRPTRMGRVWSLFLSLWGEQRAMLHTRLSPDQCVALLKEDLGGWLAGGHALVTGRVGRRQASLARRTFYRNSFRDVVTVLILTDAAQGTRLNCVAGANPFVRIFISVWFGLIGLWWIAVTLVAIIRPSWTVVLMLFAPVPMLAFGVGLVAFCRRLAEKDEGVVTSYLKQRLDAS